MKNPEPEANNKAGPPAFAGAAWLGVTDGDTSCEKSETPEHQYFHSIASRFPYRSFSRFFLSLEVGQELRRLVALEYNDLPSIEASLELWKSQGHPDLGEWPPRYAYWNDFVQKSEDLRSYYSDCDGVLTPNDPSSATRPTGRTDCQPRRHAGFAAAHG